MLEGVGSNSPSSTLPCTPHAAARVKHPTQQRAASLTCMHALLAACAAQGALTEREALRIMRMLLSAVAYAHDMGVMHRDIKVRRGAHGCGHGLHAPGHQRGRLCVLLAGCAAHQYTSAPLSWLLCPATRTAAQQHTVVRRVAQRRHPAGGLGLRRIRGARLQEQAPPGGHRPLYSTGEQGD